MTLKQVLKIKIIWQLIMFIPGVVSAVDLIVVLMIVPGLNLKGLRN